MRRIIILAVLPFMIFAFSACNGKSENSPETETQITYETQTNAETQTAVLQEETTQMSSNTLDLTVDGISLDVEWEDNDAVADLLSLAKNGKITVKASQYGGFEQVGSLPESLTRNDSEITALSGDIMLYSGNQIVIFYGSNSWSYTRLGHINGVSQEELTQMLDKDTVSVVISNG